jgi:hypothetical protein
MNIKIKIDIFFFIFLVARSLRILDFMYQSQESKHFRLHYTTFDFVVELDSCLFSQCMDGRKDASKNLELWGRNFGFAGGYKPVKISKET